MIVTNFLNLTLTNVCCNMFKEMSSYTFTNAKSLFPDEKKYSFDYNDKF